MATGDGTRRLSGKMPGEVTPHEFGLRIYDPPGAGFP